VLEKPDTQVNTGNAEEFRVFQTIMPPKAGNFAYLRPSKVQAVGIPTHPYSRVIGYLSLGVMRTCFSQNTKLIWVNQQFAVGMKLLGVVGSP